MWQLFKLRSVLYVEPMKASVPPRFVLNSTARASPHYGGLFAEAEYESVAEFFEACYPGQATPLVSLTGLAAEIGVGDILLKDESTRFGLNAFKVLGVAYAIQQLLDAGRLTPDAVLVSATTGNHGRAVAHVGRRHGFRVRIYVPAGTVPARRAALESEGAVVVIVDGNYDEAVRQAARDANEHGWTAVSDTAWPGYEEIPRWIMAGYTRLLFEAERCWGTRPPDIVLVQAGVGGLAGAVASWCSHRFAGSRPFIITCEPLRAACVLESVRAGRPVAIHGDLATEMSGLRAGEMSSIVWPAISHGIDACVAIDDERVFATMKVLARPRGNDLAVVAGPSGACGVAVLRAVMTAPELEPVRAASGLSLGSRVLVINTEGATDPDLYDRVVNSHRTDS